MSEAKTSEEYNAELDRRVKVTRATSLMTPARLAEIKALNAYTRAGGTVDRITEELLAALETERARLAWLIDQLLKPDEERAELAMSTRARLDCGISREDLLAEWRRAIDEAREREKGETQ